MGRQLETALLAEIQARIDRISEMQHDLARQKHVLMHAATQLRLGRVAQAVIAEIEEQSPALAAGMAAELEREAAPAASANGRRVRPLGRAVVGS